MTNRSAPKPRGRGTDRRMPSPRTETRPAPNRFRYDVGDGEAPARRFRYEHNDRPASGNRFRYDRIDGQR